MACGSDHLRQNFGGGLPVGAFGGRADIMDCIAPAGPVYQAGTLSGNPLAMAAGLNLKHLTQEVYDNLATTTQTRGWHPGRCQHARHQFV